MSRGRKSAYPERPIGGKRPSRPGEGRNRPSSQSGGGKRKNWLSLRERVENGRDVGVRLNFPWFKAPMYVEERLKKWR